MLSTTFTDDFSVLGKHFFVKVSFPVRPYGFAAIGLSIQFEYTV